ncbi:MAG: phenylalanine--tRNA ligase beta subunit-related protein [Pseudomonadota bacterium]
MIEISIAEDFAAAGIAVSLGCLEARVEVRESDPALAAAMAEAVARRAEALADGAVAEIPEVAAARKAYKAGGKDPSRYRPSSEALLRRVAQGKGLYRINTLVDCNNLISLETGLPLGCYRRDRIAPPVVFRLGRGGESYQAIGRGPLNLEKLPLFADKEGPFGSPTSDSARTMIDLSTERMVMVLIAFGGDDRLDTRLSDATRTLERFCAATEVQRNIISSQWPSS